MIILCADSLNILQTKNTNVNSGNVNSHRTDCAEVRKEKYWIISWWITALGQFIPAVKSRKINDQPKLSWEPENINMIYFIHRILGKENEGGSHTTFLNSFYHEDYHCWWKGNSGVISFTPTNVWEFSVIAFKHASMRLIQCS